jgi:CRP-like cAMP-binding protein
METLKTTPQERAAWLAHCPLFAELPAQDREALAGALVAKGYEAGEALFQQGDEAQGFHLLWRGQVKVSRFGPDGREQVVHLIRPGEPCGEVPAFEGGAYPATATALGPAATFYLLRSRFLDLGMRRPQLFLGMLAILSRRLRGLVQLVDDLALRDVSARLARHLLDLSDRGGGGGAVRLATTKAILAGRLGTISETLSRTFARLQSQGLIRVEGRTIHLLDPQALREIAEGRGEGERRKTKGEEGRG